MIILWYYKEQDILIYIVQKKEKASFIVTPDQVYKNEKLYYDGPAMIVWPAGIFHRIISGRRRKY